MSATTIKLARTTVGGRYLNPQYEYNSSGTGIITNAQPWVQTFNKQLWIDNVCINPKLTIAPVTYTYGAEQQQCNFATLEKVLDKDALCTNTIRFNFDDLKDYFNNTNYFNSLSFGQVQRNNHNVIQTANNEVAYTEGVINIYNPVLGASQLPKIFLGKNLKTTVDDVNNHIFIESQYISSITTMTGDVLSEALGNGVGHQTIYLDYDTNQGTIESDAVYLVVTSNFGLSKFMKLVNASGNTESHDALHVTTSIVPEQGATYIETYDVLLYTYQANNGVRFYGSTPDANHNGTDVYFKTPTETLQQQPVSIIINQIDGGEIIAPSV